MEQKNDLTKKEKLPPFVGNESGGTYSFEDAAERLDEIIGTLIWCYGNGSEATSSGEISSAYYFLAGLRDQFRDQGRDMQNEPDKKKAPDTFRYRSTEPVDGDWSKVYPEKVEVEVE